jgi:hypothetical protein
MKTWNYPAKSAFKLAQQMRKFRAQTEENALSETNPNADNDRREVVRQMDWYAFSQVIDYLEFTHLNTEKRKNKSLK